MTSIIGFICIVLMLASFFLLIFGLPGNWVMLGVAFLWTLYTKDSVISWGLLASMAFCATIGEIAEFVAGHYGTKHFGGTKRGSLGGIIGGIIGSIMLAPLFFGLGALIGAFCGGFLGCFIFEKIYSIPTQVALRSAWGTTLGKIGGFIIKVGVSFTILYYLIPSIWQDM